MDSDDEHDDFDVTEEFFRHSSLRTASEQRTPFDYFQRFIPQQTIIYIQYCLLRVPFLLLYDYSFTEHFAGWIGYCVKYSMQIVGQDKHIFYTPISYILHSYLFEVLMDINLLFSIPILGRVNFYRVLVDEHIYLF
jgi:hypothetical protein